MPLEGNDERESGNLLYYVDIPKQDPLTAKAFQIEDESEQDAKKPQKDSKFLN